jgi:rare lipoprotein A
VDAKSINNKIACSKKIQVGLASFYGKKDGFSGKRTASGEKMSPWLLTAAHPSLPLQSLVLVQDTETGAETVVRINDRGPYSGGRIIDLTPAAARKLHISEDKGVAKVRLFMCRRLALPIEPP